MGLTEIEPILGMLYMGIERSSSEGRKWDAHRDSHIRIDNLRFDEGSDGKSRVDLVVLAASQQWAWRRRDPASVLG